MFNNLSTKVKPQDKILIPCSKHARTYIGEKLKSYGAIVDIVHIYEPVCGKLTNADVFAKRGCGYIYKPFYGKKYD